VLFVISVTAYVYSGRVGTTTEITLYFVKRIAHIYPLHIITICVTALLFFGFYLTTGTYGFIYKYNDFYDFLLNVLLLQQVAPHQGYSFNAPSWTISTQIFVNVVFGILLFWRLQHGAVILSIVAISSIYLFSISGKWSTEVSGLVDPSLVRTFAGFFVGILSFRIGSLKTRTSEMIAAVTISFGLATIIGAMMLPRGESAGSILEVVATLVGAPLLVFGCVWSPRIEVLGASWLGTWLGKISYSLYIWHFPVACCFVLFGVPALISGIPLFTIYTSAVLVAATLSHYYIEWPARMKILRFAAERREPRIPAE
jgi:peptidoglycan/LPS O-acetylase OafA/YrhL